MLGISVYLSDYNPNYVRDAAKIGAKIVFTSLQIPEEKEELVRRRLPLLIRQCTELKLQLMADISPISFEKIGLAQNDYEALKKLGVKIVRLDSGYDDFALIKQLQQYFSVVLNASIIDEHFIEAAKKAKVDFSKITLTYNYYPHSETGLSWDKFKRYNLKLHKKGLITQAFVSGNFKKRFPLYEGLPTVEKQRAMNPYVAAVQLMHDAKVDNVVIGDNEATISTLKNIVSYQKGHVLHLHCHLETENQSLYGQKIEVRKDQPDKLIRLLLPRKDGIMQHNTAERIRGSIVMQNHLARRYSGEIYLIKKDLPFEARSNMIGFIQPDELPLLDLIDSNMTIVFSPLK